MAYKFGKHSDYMLKRAEVRIARAKLKYPIVPVIVTSVDKEPDDSWEPVLYWMKQQMFRSYTWTPFATTEWRRYFVFEDESHLLLFKLSFAGYNL